MLKDVLAVAKDNPDIIKIPTVQVNGTTAGFEGAAAILGASNLVQMLGKSTTTGKPEAK
jgi:hypothetical protein